MKIFKWIAIFLFVLIGAILISASTKPDTLRVERSASIGAAPEKIFPLINNFHRWEEWSPWDKKDPAMKRNYSGPESGPGAVYEWDGNDDVGKGKTEIVTSEEPKKVHIKLSFERPFECENAVDFTLDGQGETTRVTWVMEGPNNFISKLMQVFMNMDKMIGNDFEAGLASMKKIAEQTEP